MGRLIGNLAARGAAIAVGMDLSESVEIACERTRP
jgi:hypothetical protein